MPSLSYVYKSLIQRLVSAQCHPTSPPTDCPLQNHQSQSRLRERRDQSKNSKSLAAAPSTVSLKPGASCSASFAKIPRQALIVAALMVGLRGRAREGRKDAVVQASLFSPKPPTTKDTRPAKV